MESLPLRGEQSIWWRFADHFWVASGFVAMHCDASSCGARVVVAWVVVPLVVVVVAVVVVASAIGHKK